MKWKSDAAPACGTSTADGTSTSGTTNGTTDGRRGGRTTSAAWTPRRRGRISCVAWRPTTGGRSRSSPAGGRGSRGSSWRIPPLRGTPRRSFDIPDRDGFLHPVSLSHGGQVDTEEGEGAAESHRHAGSLVQQDPGEQARSDRLADQAQAHDGRGHPPQGPIVQRVPADLRDDRQGEEEGHLLSHVPERDQALPQDHRISEQDSRRARVHDERVGQERDPLPEPATREEVESRGDASEEREQVSDPARRLDGRVGDRDQDDPAEAEADADRHPSRQPFPKHEMGEDADEEGMGGDEDHGARDAHLDRLDFEGTDPQGEVGREDRPHPDHARHVLARQVPEAALRIEQSERREDERGEGEAVQGDRNERRGGPRDEDGRRGHGDDRESYPEVRPCGHGVGTSARLCNRCGAHGLDGGGGGGTGGAPLRRRRTMTKPAIATTASSTSPTMISRKVVLHWYRWLLRSISSVF